MSETTLNAIGQLIVLILFFGIALTFYLMLCAFSKLGEMDREFRLTVVSDWQEVRLDKFTVRSGVHVAVARWYLNSKTRQLNGLCEVDEFGDVVYLFGEAKRKYLQEHVCY